MLLPMIPIKKYSMGLGKLFSLPSQSIDCVFLFCQCHRQFTVVESMYSINTDGKSWFRNIVDHYHSSRHYSYSKWSSRWRFNMILSRIQIFLASRLYFPWDLYCNFLPIIISFPGGALRSALRICWLLPKSMLSRWILALTAPFYSILLCVALILVVVMQVAGNFLLFIGTLLLCRFSGSVGVR